MNPDPNLVVEALRKVAKDHWHLPLMDLQRLAVEALPHAEAIAEMWVKDTKFGKPVVYWWEQANTAAEALADLRYKHEQLREATAITVEAYKTAEAVVLDREPAVLELIAAARELKENGYRAVRSDWDRLNSALKNLEAR